MDWLESPGQISRRPVPKSPELDPGCQSEPRGTTHSATWPVNSAIRSKSAS